MKRPDGSTLSATPRARAGASTLGMIVLIYLQQVRRGHSDWWMWAVEIGLFNRPAGTIAFVERGPRSGEA
jgi:hypothetical protein